jgi:hypothetical protein
MARLRRADELLREARYAEAVAEYGLVAETYAAAGFALKSAAIWKQIVGIVDRSAPELAEVRTRSLRGLLAAYTALGLTSEANEVRQRLN